MVQMTERQLTFWRELLAPFDRRDLSTVKRGIELTYIDARALMNRLDSVVGPNGWDINYRPTERGYIARMGIRIPTADDDGWEWMWKEDGGGFEGMTKKAGGENVDDVDNDEKSAFTNAFRRVAQNAWGIGRYLYKKGAPTWLGDETLARPDPSEEQVEPPRQATPEPRAQQAPAPGPPRQYDNFVIPRPGKGVFPTIKRWEEHFKTSLFNGVKTQAQKLGWATQTDQWDQDQINTLFGDLINYICSVSNYAGEFDKLGLPTQAPAQVATPPAAAPATAAAKPADPLTPLRKEVIAAVTKERTLALQRTPTSDEIGREIGKFAQESPDQHGRIGAAFPSLKTCADEVWLRNILAGAKSAIARLEAPPGRQPGDDDDEIPF